ncbi:MAG: hypothetical protein ACP6IS_09685 [Candidatus Asgardarchaeia archaeon]
MIRRKSALFIALVSVLVLSLTTYWTIAQNSGSIPGYLTVSTPPSVDAITLFSDDDGGTTTTTSTLTPQDEMTLKVDISDPDGLDTLSSIQIVLYHSSVGVSDSDDPALHVTITWDTTNGWSLSPSSTWSLDTEHSSVPTTGTSGSIYVVFTPGKVTRYSASGEWTIYVNVTDSQGQYGDGSLTNLNTAFYAELSVTTTSFNFGLVGPGVQNASLQDPTSGYITITVIANGNFGIKITGDGWYNSSDDLVVNFDSFNSLLVDDDGTPVEDPETGLNPFWVRSATTVTAPQWDGFSPTDESGTSYNLYLYVTLPSNLPAGDYHTTITITITGP